MFQSLIGIQVNCDYKTLREELQKVSNRFQSLIGIQVNCDLIGDWDCHGSWLFQSLIGIQVNCDGGLIELVEQLDPVSIPDRDSSQL